MRIFFSMAHLGGFRMYEPVLRELARRGHEIHLSIGRSDARGWDGALQRLIADCPSVTWSVLSPPGATFWAELARTIRIWADYLRYFHPDYDAAPKLKARAAERVPPRLVAIANRPGFASHPGNRRRLVAGLRLLERALPLNDEVERELRARRPDLVLVSPLVFLGSPQFDILRSSLAAGLTTAYAVGSWDHLSSKALIRDMPHRVFVWNDTQKDEAVRLHGVPPERVVVTGAQCYDQWFERRPVRSREAFCARVGLPGDRKFLLYVCSALFWGSPVEAEFVLRWIRSVRESAEPSVRDAAILIRPHPSRMEEWASIDLSGFEHVSFYGSNPVDADSKDDYFESLYYCSAVVGLNTSAFIEGAVVGRPAYTVLAPEFHENQEGVLHFHYLLTVGGGVLRAARSFEDHHAQLSRSLTSPAADRSSDGFVRAFVRPHGLDRAATPAFCDAVDELLAMPRPAPVRTPLRLVALRWVMYPAFRLLRLIYGAELIRDDWSRHEAERAQARAAIRHEREERHRRVLEKQQARERQRAATAAHREQKVARKAAAQAEKVARKAAVQAQRHREQQAQRRRATRARILSRVRRLLPFGAHTQSQP
jgi:hypothetical protein